MGIGVCFMAKNGAKLYQIKDREGIEVSRNISTVLQKKISIISILLSKTQMLENLMNFEQSFEVLKQWVTQINFFWGF